MYAATHRERIRSSGLVGYSSSRIDRIFLAHSGGPIGNAAVDQMKLCWPTGVAPVVRVSVWQALEDQDDRLLGFSVVPIESKHLVGCG